ncbi:MAG: peptide chain release factor N(5)-glutamine methyltransferase [Candidatus Omnitrophota bacterium]
MNERELMLTALLNCRRVDLYVDPQPLTGRQARSLDRMERKRKGGEPLQYILGCCEFMGFKMLVNKHVLIPRPETELLVEWAVEKSRLLANRDLLRILDLGTGSGNMAVSLAKLIEQSQIVAVDKSQRALAVARKNAEINQVQHKINFIHQDMRAYLKRFDQGSASFDIIVSNPPYIKTSFLNRLPLEVRSEPKLALDGGPDGLYYYRAIIENSRHLLKNGGYLFLEIGDGQRPDLEGILKPYPGFEKIEFKKDYSSVDRVVAVQLFHGSEFPKGNPSEKTSGNNIKNTWRQ